MAGVVVDRLGGNGVGVALAAWRSGPCYEGLARLATVNGLLAHTVVVAYPAPLHAVPVGSPILVGSCGRWPLLWMPPPSSSGLCPLFFFVPDPPVSERGRRSDLNGLILWATPF
jgi:hypothetical protein